MNPSVKKRIAELSSRRSVLKGARDYRAAIPLQLELIELFEEHGRLREDIAGAHNYASGLYLRCDLYHAAEHHARVALALSCDQTVHDLEARGCYHRVLAQILAAQYRYDEALPFAENALRDYGVFHNPPDDFLAGVSSEVEQIRNRTWSPPPD
jgi:hypothetical protein